MTRQYPRLNEKLIYFAQLPLTCLVLAFVPTNTGKWAALLLIWAFTFRRISMPELRFFGIFCALFALMNKAALDQGIFVFSYPDIWGMPAYELTMWGFYALHTHRMIPASPLPRPDYRLWLLVIAFSASFATLKDPTLLLMVTGTLLAVGLYWHHDRYDLAYVAYMITVGAAIEYTGVLSGQWHYPGDPIGGVPFWFVTLWGGVGFFIRRWAGPLILEHCQIMLPTQSPK